MLSSATLFDIIKHNDIPVLTRWKNSSLLLVATPVVIFLVQLLAFSYATLSQNGIGFLIGLLLSSLSIPALVFSIRRVRSKEERILTWIACVLNGAYAALFSLTIVAVIFELTVAGHRVR